MKRRTRHAHPLDRRLSAAMIALWFGAGAIPVSSCASGRAASPDAQAAAPATPTPTAPASAAGIDPGGRTWGALVSKVGSPDLVDRFLEASRMLLGVSYANGPLGEGNVGGPDPDPRVDLNRVDCVTYLEESLALAMSWRRSESDFLRILDAIRYAEGEVGFASRNHYMMRDWVPANRWLVDDVTAEVGAKHVRSVRKTIDRGAFLREQGASPRPGVDDASTIEFAMIPLADIASVGAGLRAGDLVLWVAKKDGIDIAHTGLITRNPQDGSLVHRHASSKAGKATEEPLLAYANRATFADGIVVLRVKPEAAPAGFAGDE